MCSCGAERGVRNVAMKLRELGMVAGKRRSECHLTLPKRSSHTLSLSPSLPLLPLPPTSLQRNISPQLMWMMISHLLRKQEVSSLNSFHFWISPSPSPSLSPPLPSFSLPPFLPLFLPPLSLFSPWQSWWLPNPPSRQ